MKKTSTDSWLDMMTKDDKPFLLEEEIKNTIKEIGNMINDACQNANKKQILIDRPIDVNKASLKENGSQKAEISVEYDVPNKIKASDLFYTQELSAKEYVETLLTTIFSLIRDLNEEGETSFEFNFAEEWKELFSEPMGDLNKTEKIVDKVTEYLDNFGYKVFLLERLSRAENGKPAVFESYSYIISW